MSLPVPRGRQHHVVHLPAKGEHVVLGTAGTGKSTMAVLRADNLAATSTRDSGPVLLVTYNNALVTYLRSIQGGSGHGITVETYGKFARGYLASRGLMSWNAIAGPRQREQFVREAVAQVTTAHPRSALLKRDLAFFLDEFEWICGMGLASVDEYQAARRYGRESPLNDAQRSRVWEVFTAYRALRDTGYDYDWYDIATAVRRALANDDSPRHYRHVVIDEGQDLSPEAVRSLVEATPDAGSVTFFGDYHQAIYGQGLSWRAIGLDLGGRPVEKFQDNYRNSTEIARLAIALADSPYMVGDREDLVEPRQPTAAGPKPTLVRCRDRAHEIQVVRERAAEMARDRTVAVLARTWADANRATRGLDAQALDPDMNYWDTSPGIHCGAYHSAKGLEFDAVVMPFVSDGRVPLPDVVSAFGDEEACSREARLLYVAITRAKTDLIVTYSGDVSPLLPTDPALWTVVDA